MNVDRCDRCVCMYMYTFCAHSMPIYVQICSSSLNAVIFWIPLRLLVVRRHIYVRAIDPIALRGLSYLHFVCRWLINSHNSQIYTRKVVFFFRSFTIFIWFELMSSRRNENESHENKEGERKKSCFLLLQTIIMVVFFSFSCDPQQFAVIPLIGQLNCSSTNSYAAIYRSSFTMIVW